MKYTPILFAYAAVVSLFSCSEKKEELIAISHVSAMMAPPALMYDEAPPVQGRKLIRHAALNIEVSDLHKSYDSIKLLTAAAQGYMADEDHGQTDTRINQDMAILIPEGKFDTFLVSLEGLSKKILRRNITTQDVTAEIEDMTVRLKTKKALESQYNEILRQARTVKDMLAIEEQLGTVREEIESMEARKRSMDKQIAYSVIDLSIFQITAPEPDYGDRFVDALLEGWQGLTGMLLSIIASWPLLILITPLAWGIRTRYRRFTRRNDTTAIPL
jgi:hypothetical protein